MIPLNSILAKRIGDATRELMKHKDDRVQRCTELLHGIRVGPLACSEQVISYRLCGDVSVVFVSQSRLDRRGWVVVPRVPWLASQPAMVEFFPKVPARPPVSKKFGVQLDCTLTATRRIYSRLGVKLKLVTHSSLQAGRKVTRRSIYSPWLCSWRTFALNPIQAVKMLAWEEPIRRRIDESRDKEVRGS